MEFRHLRYFLAVAEELHFGRAAKRLNMSQPPLSQQILQLENELGVKLFRRNKRQVNLTLAGQMFAKESRLVLAQLDHAAMTAVQAAAGQIGHLVIGTVSSVNSIFYRRFVQILRTYTGRHPHVRLALQSMTTPQQIEALHTGRLDVGFLTANLDHDSILTAEPVQGDQLALAVPPDHRLAKLAPFSIRMLAVEPFILTSRHLAPAYHDLVVTWFLDQGFSLNVVYEADSFFTMTTLVAAGLGLALLPASLQGANGNVVFRKLPARPPYVELLLAHRRESSEVVNSFVSVAKDVSSAAQPINRARRRERAR